MMDRILIDPGKIPYDKIIDTIKRFRKRVDVVYERNERNTVWENSPGVEAKEYSSLINKYCTLISEEELGKAHEALKTILADQRTFLIAERISQFFLWDSLIAKVIDIERMVTGTISYLLTTRPRAIFFHSAPHGLYTWVLGKCGEFLGIPVIFIQTSPLPWKFWLVEGIDAQEPISDEALYELDSKANDEVDSYVELLRADYQSAIPSYERERLEARNNSFWSWRVELFNAFSRPRRFLLIPLKRKLYLRYLEKARAPDFSKNCIVFFLHYQPERTSLPDGGGFAQQWLIIAYLSRCLPAGWELLVKEHPSTFTGEYDIRYRNPAFYERIVALGNVRIVGLGEDTFGLIDRSRAIATITGTVGVQALVRGKPVLAFGAAAYRPFNGVYNVKTVDDIRAAIGDIARGIREPVVGTEEELYKVNRMSLSGFDGKFVLGEINSMQTRLNGCCKLLKAYLEISFTDTAPCDDASRERQ